MDRAKHERTLIVQSKTMLAMRQVATGNFLTPAARNTPLLGQSGAAEEQKADEPVSLPD